MNFKEADVIIIGGGIAGSSIAYRLAEKGQHVVLLEKGRVGEEASGRAGGLVRQQHRHPAELPLAMAAIKIWSQMKAELDWNVGYRQNGMVMLAKSREDYENFHEYTERERNMGLGVSLLTPEETRALIPALSNKMDLIGGKYCPTDGTANPLLVVKAIARSARNRGVQIREHEPVKDLKLKAGRVAAVATEQGEYRAAVFVNAAGAWAKSICNRIALDFPVSIRRAQIFVTDALPPVIEPGIGFDLAYVRQTLEGNIHLGLISSPVEKYDTRSTFQAFVDLGRNLPEVFPFLKEINIIRAFAGLTHWTPDAIPIMDRAPNLDNFYLTAGFSGHGFCLGPMVGKLMAEWIVNGKPSLDLSPFKWTRFDNIDLHKNDIGLSSG